MPFLNESNRALRGKARSAANELVRPLAQKYDYLQEYPWEILEGLKARGLMGVWIPEEYGGQGGSVLDLCLVIEELSRACGGVGTMYAVNALGSFPIMLAGTEDQKKRFLPSIARGEKLIAFGLSEKMAGSDASSLKTMATKDGDDYIIQGEKKWTTNGGAADYYTVFAVTDPDSKKRRVSALIVEKDMEGFSIGKVEDKMGIRCVPVVEAIYDNVRVPSSNLLGGEPGLGFRHAMMTLDLARPGVAAQAMGLAQGALDLALAYTHRREQFGQTVASFQMVQGMLADMSSKTSAARQLIYAAAKAAADGHPDLSLFSAQCKLLASDVAMQVTTDAVQLFGGYGYMRDYPIEKFMRDAKITQIYEGTNQIQRLVVARNLTKYVERDLGFLDDFIPQE